jgi:hypothetical protein
MKKISTIIGSIVLTTFIAIGGVFAQQAKHTGSIQVNNDNEAEYASMATISLDSAIQTALNQVPGKVLKAEIENENGYLVYGVEIVKADKQIADVKVDAGNGKILKVDVDHKDHNVHEVHEEDSDNEREEVNER